MAGTVGGLTYGVAKNVSLHAMRILDCAGDGTVADVIMALDWLKSNAQRPAIATMSLGGGAGAGRGQGMGYAGGSWAGVGRGAEGKKAGSLAGATCVGSSSIHFYGG